MKSKALIKISIGPDWGDYYYLAYKLCHTRTRKFNNQIRIETHFTWSIYPKKSLWTDLVQEGIEILLEVSLHLNSWSSTGCWRIKKRKKLIQTPIIRMVCKYAEFHTLRFRNPNWLSHVMSSRDCIITFGSQNFGVMDMSHDNINF